MLHMVIERGDSDRTKAQVAEEVRKMFPVLRHEFACRMPNLTGKKIWESFMHGQYFIIPPCIMEP